MIDAFALLGINLVLCVMLLSLMRAVRLHSAWVNGIATVVFVLLWIPLGAAQIPAVAYVRGITADLSVTLVSLAVWQLCCLASGWRAVAKSDLQAVLVAVAVAALFLYPLALGWGDWDAYRLGWGSWSMLGVLLVLCAVCWAKGLRMLPALVALALLAWSLGWMESGNLWDYLLDPWLSLYSLGFVFMMCIQVVKGFPKNI